MDLLSGLLSGIESGSKAVVQIAEDEKKRLAEKLKREALIEIERASKNREFAHKEKIAGMQAESAKELETTRAENRGLLAEKESQLRREETMAEIEAKKKAGVLQPPKPIVLGPYDKAISTTGKEIARGLETSSTTGTRPSDKINAQKAAIAALQKLALPPSKGGIGWKRGEEIPGIELDRINSLLKAAGEPEITQEKIRKEPGFFIKMWDGLFGRGEMVQQGPAGELRGKVMRMVYDPTTGKLVPKQ